MRIFRCLLLVVFVLGGSAAHARESSLEDYENVPATGKDGKPLAAEQIRKAIFLGADMSRWVVSVKESGNTLKATYTWGSHTAVVDIEYAAGRYSIRYVDSRNLDFSEKNGVRVVHPAYNTVVTQLKTRIDGTLKLF